MTTPIDDTFNVFWGSPDSWVQERYNYKYNDLEIELKLLSLLFDTIILPPSFLLESEVLNEVLLNNILLVETGVVKISFRTTGHDMIDYSNLKKDEKVDKSLFKNKTYPSGEMHI